MKALMVVLLLANFQAVNDEADVARAVETLKQAMLDGNRQALEKIAADELTYGHSSGLLEDKATFVEALASGKSDFTTINFTDQVVKVVGNTATVRHKLSGDIVNNGATGKVNLSVLLIWVKIKGEWKLLARQAVKI
jgi:hypothetical protein